MEECFWFCVLIGRLPDPGVSTPAPLSVAAVGVSFPKIQNEPRGYVCVGVYLYVCQAKRRRKAKGEIDKNRIN